jgi:hypothetical protein
MSWFSPHADAPAVSHSTRSITNASVTDGAANVGTATQQLTIDTVLPVVTIDGGATVLTNDLTPTISGTTDIAAGQIVTVTATSTATTITRTALVQTDHSYDVTPTLTAGAWVITATVTDPAGNIGTTTQSLDIDTTGPTVTIAGGANSLTNDSRPVIAGTADAVTVTVTIDGQNASGVVIAGGSWSVPYPGAAAALADGSHHISVEAHDAAGNMTTVTQTLAVDTIAPMIVIAPGATYSTNDTTPTIAGTTDVPAGSGVTVNVMIDAIGPGMTATVQVDGTWNVTPGSALAAGSHTIVATIADLATNSGTATQTLIIDTVAPVVTIDGGSSRTTADATPTITGQSADVAVGSTVTISVAGQALTAIIDGAGTFTTTAATITNGTHFVLVTVIDPAGNAGNAIQTLTIDAVAPSVMIDFGATHITNDDTPLIGGTTSAATGSAVTVTVDGQTLSAIVQPGGSWNVTAAHIDNGDVNVIVTIVDADGNFGTASQMLTVDSNAPTPISITGGPARSTNDDTPAIVGTTGAADGRIITVTVNGQTLTVAAVGGAWGVNAAHLNDGTYSVEVSVSSAGGNAGAATQQLTIDTVAPVVVLPGGPNVDTTDPTPTITGMGTPGSTVTVTVAGQTLTTTIASDGSWSVTTGDLSPGPHAVVVAITDPAGNIGTAVQTITVSSAPENATVPDFVSVGPKRVFDTRPGTSSDTLAAVNKQQVGGSYELQVQMTGLVGFVPATGVGAVSLNVTSTGSEATGYITVYGCGNRESVSSVNFPAGGTVANAVIAPVSGTGTVCFYANTPTDIIVDINGWFATGTAFNNVGPKRVFDTRSGTSTDTLRNPPKTKVPAGGTIEVQLTDLAGYVPASGVGAVSLNVVVTNPEAGGFVTVFPCGTPGLVSSVNFAVGQTVANAVIAPVSSTGMVCFYSVAGTDLIVDINGWFQAGSAFAAVTPVRVFDTRTGSADGLRTVSKAKIGGGNILRVKVTDLPGLVPAAGVSAVSLNVTATNADATGFVTVFACGNREEVSSVNFGPGQAVANAVLAPVAADGSICFYANTPTDVIADINGWIRTAGPV